MSTKTIPEAKIWTCDGCAEEIESNHKPSRWTHLKWLRDALDFQGHAIAADNIERDFCGSCSIKLGDVINDAFSD